MKQRLLVRISPSPSPWGQKITIYIHRFSSKKHDTDERKRKKKRKWEVPKEFPFKDS
jgi:hypothetical protein